MRARDLLLAGPALLAAGIGGCEKNEGFLPGNQMPRTYLSVIRQGTELDTTDYRKALHWWGTDPDGRISGYLIRWDGGFEPPEGTRTVYEGEAYSFTTANQDTFDVPLGGTYAVRTFTVRAVDDRGLVDAAGAVQAFRLKNHVPHIEWNAKIPLPDTSLAAVGFGWRASDFDGRATVGSFRVWLDGDSARAQTVADTVFALRPEDFGDRVDQTRTVYVRAYDDAQAPSDVTLSHAWHVQSPRGRYLYLRQVSAGNQIDRWDRKVYQALLDESVGAADLHVIDFYAGPDFATAAEVEPLFSLFDGVVWLTGPFDTDNDAKMARNLATAEQGLRAYVERGGRVLLIGQTVLGTDSGLSTRFAEEALGVTSLYRKVPNEPGEITTTNLPLARDEYVHFRTASVAESIRVQSTSNQVDYLLSPTVPGTGRYWVAPGVLYRMIGEPTDPPQDEATAYVGLVSSFGAGRITVVTTGYARLFPNPGNGAPQGIEEGVRLFREALIP